MKKLTLLILITLGQLSFGIVALKPDGSMQIYATTPQNGIVVSLNGDVGIGTITPTDRLQVLGTVNATGFEGKGTGLTNIPASAMAAGSVVGGSGGTIEDGTIENIDISANAAISWTKISKTGSSIGDISNVALSSPALNQVLVYNGSNWVNQNSAPNATNANQAVNIANGGSGGVPYQTGTSVTTFALPSVSGEVLQYQANGTVAWVGPNTLGVGNATTAANWSGASTWTGSTAITTLGTISAGTIPVARVSGLGSLATLSSINNANWSGTVLTVPNGGTGTTTLTGIIKGNGVGAFTAATAGSDYAAASHTHSGTDVTTAVGNATTAANWSGASSWAGSTSITTLGNISAGTVPVARVSGLGTLATLSSINNANWSGTVLAVANGGTGASSLSGLSVGYATTAGRAYPLAVGGGSLNFNWSGQGGQPPWLWGGSDGVNMYVYNPSNFSVNTAANLSAAANTNVNITTSGTGYTAINGNVGIGMAPNSYTVFMQTYTDKFSIAGNGYISGSWNQGSDIRFKKNIIPLKDSLQKVLLLQGVNYDWRQDEFPSMNFGHGRQVGVIAQDVEKVVPEIVSTGTNGYKSVAYDRLGPILIEAVKELKAEKDTEIIELKSQIKVLQLVVCQDHPTANICKGK